nr:hypothetical protein [Salmonella enterica subsp. enterica serovar Rissen]
MLGCLMISLTALQMLPALGWHHTKLRDLDILVISGNFDGMDIRNDGNAGRRIIGCSCRSSSFFAVLGFFFYLLKTARQYRLIFRIHYDNSRLMLLVYQNHSRLRA